MPRDEDWTWAKYTCFPLSPSSAFSCSPSQMIQAKAASSLQPIQLTWLIFSPAHVPSTQGNLWVPQSIPEQMNTLLSFPLGMYVKAEVPFTDRGMKVFLRALETKYLFPLANNSIFDVSLFATMKESREV